MLSAHGHRPAGVSLALVSALLALSAALPAVAQDLDDTSVSRPVVQQVPNSDTMALNTALARVAQNPRDSAALVDAGNAALLLGDTDAAVGFFRRAGQIAPSDGRVKAGLAGAFVRNGDPFSAIPLFDEAERAGVVSADMLSDRGLAFDLVGNNPRAQTYYRQALARGAGPETVRRLALSQAIGGDRRGAEGTLAPLLQAQDKAAERVRIFALSSAGASDEAITLARSTMPPELAGGLAPYLRYMRMLTPAQQAAAATLGQFPRASEIGRDDPRVAAFAPPRPVVLAQASPATTTGTRPGRTRRGNGAAGNAALPPVNPVPQVVSAQQAAKAEAPARSATVASAAAPVRSRGERIASVEIPRPGSLLPARVAAAPAAVRANEAAPSVASVRSAQGGQAAIALPTPSQGAVPAQSGSAANAPRVALMQGPPAPVDGELPAIETAPEAAPQAIVQAAAAPPPVPAVPAPVPSPALSQASAGPVVSASTPSMAVMPPQGQSLALAAGAAPSEAVAPQVSVPVAASVAAPVVPQPSRTLSVAEAFAEFSAPVGDALPAPGAVDMRRIRPSRETLDNAGKPDASGKPGARAGMPSHPSRIWVQVATGRDKAALAFDWRRLQRQSADVFRNRKGYVAAWGQTNRLLTGPFDTEAAANTYIGQLRRASVGNPFVWTSPAGQVVDAIDGGADVRASDQNDARRETRQEKRSESKPASRRGRR